MSSREQTEKRRVPKSPARTKREAHPKLSQAVDTIRLDEQEWLVRNGPRYMGQWVAIEGSRLLSHGADAVEVLKQARAQGVASPLIVRVPHGPELPWGGW